MMGHREVGVVRYGLLDAAATTDVHVPGVPATVQIQILPVWSITKSPTAHVPEVGAPEVVAPAYREAADALGDVTPIPPGSLDETPTPRRT